MKVLDFQKKIMSNVFIHRRFDLILYQNHHREIPRFRDANLCLDGLVIDRIQNGP